jgi:molybdopterin-binding protein
VTLTCGGERLFARITQRSSAMLALASGQRVFAVIKAVSFEGGNFPHNVGARG